MEKIQVVLASPSDLADERQMIKDLVNSLNPLYMKNGICIDLRMWENSTPGMNADGPQGLIDMDLEITNADLFICMYWKKIGTKLANEDVAGTEHELNLALDSYHKRRKPDIKAFFKVIDESEKNDDTRKISAISKKLQPLGLYTPFKDISELKDNVSKILQAEVMNLIRKQGQVMPEIHKYIEISDTNEFISNFSSNNKLVLNKGYYDMLDFERENTDNIFKEEVFDGNQLVVSNISNVTVVGDNSTLLVNPRYANVICFRECSNIKLIGLTLGHTPRKGSCMGSVLRFENCNNIKLDSLELFGCGTYGIELENCTNIRTNGTKIFECSYGALSIINSNLEFSNSMIYDCNKTVGCIIEATNSQLDFNNVSIFNNYIDNYLISLESSSLFCSGVCVYSNSFAGLCNQAIPFGLFEENNVIQSGEEFNITISSSKKTTRDVYEEIKEFVCIYGKIEESVFDDGQIYINVITSRFENISQIESFIEGYDNLATACG